MELIVWRGGEVLVEHSTEGNNVRLPSKTRGRDRKFILGAAHAVHVHGFQHPTRPHCRHPFLSAAGVMTYKKPLIFITTVTTPSTRVPVKCPHFFILFCSIYKLRLISITFGTQYRPTVIIGNTTITDLHNDLHNYLTNAATQTKKSE